MVTSVDYITQVLMWCTTGVPEADIANHRLYDAEVFELSDEVSVVMILPSTDLVCSVPGIGETVHCSRNNKFTSLPLQVFELSKRLHREK